MPETVPRAGGHQSGCCQRAGVSSGHLQCRGMRCERIQSDIKGVIETCGRSSAVGTTRLKEGFEEAGQCGGAYSACECEVMVDCSTKIISSLVAIRGCLFQSWRRSEQAGVKIGQVVRNDGICPSRTKRRVSVSLSPSKGAPRKAARIVPIQSRRGRCESRDVLLRPALGSCR